MITKKYNDKIILFFAFVILIIIGINFIFKASYSIKENNLITILNERFSSFDNIGCYLTDQDELFIFLDNNDFYWFNSYSNLNKDYYQGTYNYKKGQNALEELGYSEEELKKEYGDFEDIYSFNIFSTTSSYPSKDIYPNDTWWFIIFKQHNNKVIAINRTLEVKYNLTQITN